MNNKNEQRIIKRNWKKIGIWSTVGVVGAAGVFSAIYFPIKMTKKDSINFPPGLAKRTVSETIDFKKSKTNNEKWGMFIADEDSSATDYALYGMDRSDPEFKDEINGPFGKFLTDRENATEKIDWTSLLTEDDSQSNEWLSEIITNGDKEDISHLDNPVFYGGANSIDYENAKWSGRETVNLTSNYDEESEKWSLDKGGNDKIMSGPTWIIWEGQEIKHVISGIETTATENPVISKFFLDWETKIVGGELGEPTPSILI